MNKYVVVSGDLYDTYFDTFKTLKDARAYAKKINSYSKICYICKIVEDVKEQKND